MLTMTIGILAWIAGGTVAALAIGRASRIGTDPAQGGAVRSDFR